MWQIDSVTAAGVRGRGSVDELVKNGRIPAALAEARANPHPWYRCQSLTAVASAMDDDARAAAVLDEALRAAGEQDEPNRIVSVASWPIGVFVRRGIRDVSHEIDGLLRTIGGEPNPVRRGDALLLLLHAVLGDRTLTDRVLGPLVEACAAGRGWKSRRILQFAALAFVPDRIELARELVERIPESREARRAKRSLPER